MLKVHLLDFDLKLDSHLFKLIVTYSDYFSPSKRTGFVQTNFSYVLKEKKNKKT